jgi:hypothetical protein
LWVFRDDEVIGLKAVDFLHGVVIVVHAVTTSTDIGIRVAWLSGLIPFGLVLFGICSLIADNRSFGCIRISDGTAVFGVCFSTTSFRFLARAFVPGVVPLWLFIIITRGINHVYVISRRGSPLAGVSWCHRGGWK